MAKRCDQCSQRNGANYFYAGYRSELKNVRLCKKCHSSYGNSDDTPGHKETGHGYTLYTSMESLIINEVTRSLE